MKFLIITHPYLGNYGGGLQAYALQKIISIVKFANVEIVDFQNVNLTYKIILRAFYQLIICFLLYWLPLSFLHVIPPIISRKIVKLFTRNHLNIIKHNPVNKTENVYIVGSDQVWRAGYARYLATISFFFLDFATQEQRNQSIAYAASFGSDEWEGTPEETVECAKLLREFKAVSVREQSGIKICKEVFGVEAVQMPDPTLLMHINDYDRIINSEKTWQPECKYVAAYVLDETAGKAELLQEGASAMNLHLQHLMPHATAKKRRDRFPISVPQWLRLIRDCEYFITDSFHGCVFAIIYNKPFVCLGNEGRGNARFDTLLGTFGLKDRLITDATPEKLLQVLNAPIDWERVNAIHNSERERGINFLKENLSES